MNDILTRKLTIEEQQEILNTLFGFEYVDVGNNHFVLHDDNGDEFYGITKNCQFDFSTLAGIFSYSAHVYKTMGYHSAQFDFRQVLGLQQ